MTRVDADYIANLVPREDRIIEDLRKLTHADYNRAIDLYVSWLRGSAGTLYIGQFGSIRSPGVSDLDLLVVCDDIQFAEIMDRSARIITEIPHGDYLFAHPPSIIPVSVLTESRILHTFENLKLLWATDGFKPLDPLSQGSRSSINTLVWDSSFWSMTLGWRNARLGLRMLLLFLGNVYQSIVADLRMIGDAAVADAILNAGRESRDAILIECGRAQRLALTEKLRLALAEWWQVGWRVEKWWRGQHAYYPDIGAKLLRRGNGNILFVPGNIRSHARSIDQVRDWLLWLGLRYYLMLPSFYLEVLVLLKTAFAPRLDRRAVKAATPVFKEDALNRQLLDDLIRYRQAICAVRGFCRNRGEDDFGLFGIDFVTPFHL